MDKEEFQSYLVKYASQLEHCISDSWRTISIRV